jgi:hypothetical protein
VHGSREELLAEWARRLEAEFSMDVSAVLTSDELEPWFGRVFVPRERLVVDLDGGCETVRHIVDPRLDDANWRDSEFRQWIQREVDRGKGPQPAEFSDEDTDDGEASATGSSRATTKTGIVSVGSFSAAVGQCTVVHGGSNE